MSQTHSVPFEKYHGTGNDFVVIDAREHAVADPVAFGVAVCDRETGVSAEVHGDGSGQAVRRGSDPDGREARRGSDGVLFLTLPDEGDADTADRPHVEMRLVQPDGSEAAMCGNGARVAAAWAAERLGVDELVVDTPAGERPATVHDDGSVTISMGVPSFDPAAVPLDGDEPLIETEVEGLTVTAVNTGVPHAVAVVEDVDAVDLESVAPPVRHAAVFPEGANVNLAARDGAGLRQRTFERGVEGETRSCGTGAVAVAAVAKRLGIVAGDEVRVSPPGGDLLIGVPDGEPATLTGPVAFEFAGELPTDPDEV
ncbi:MAG: diaminopimelate epimerase [Haloferacaceae archaeon]